MEFISLYERIAGITGQMLDAARQDAWEDVMTLETECRSYVDRLMAHTTPPELSEDSQRRRVQWIRKALADDAAIRDLAQPRLAKLRVLLDTTRQRRQLHTAYSGFEA